MSEQELERSYDSFFDIKLKSKNEQTRQLYRYSLKDFDKFCMGSKVLNQSLEDCLPRFRKAKVNFMTDILQTWINDSKYEGSNLKSRYYQINKYLWYRDVRLDKRDLDEIEFESSEPEERRPISYDELKKIVNAATNRQRSLILSLSSSGMAIGEACHLIKSDFDFSQSRIQIHIKKSYTKKKGRSRTVYISREAEAFVRPILDTLDDSDRVFGYSPTVEDSVNNYQNQFRRLVDKIGLGVKYESGKRQKTLHALRAYFFTKANKVHGLSYSHKMTGHKGYLEEYNRLEESEKLEMYLKLEPELFINENKPDSEEIKEIKKELEKATEKASLVDELTKKVDEQAKDIAWMKKMVAIKDQIEKQ